MVEVNHIKFNVLLREEAVGFSAQVVELPGCISQGKTKIEALANVKEAVEGYLEAFPEEMKEQKPLRKEALNYSVYLLRMRSKNT